MHGCQLRQRARPVVPKHVIRQYHAECARFADMIPGGGYFTPETYGSHALYVGLGSELSCEDGVVPAAAELKPADKIAWLETHARNGHKVLMAGDGLNDAPALAAAHASISPASAADISQRAADFVFQGGKLWPVVEAISTGRRAHRMAFQNFGVAAVYNTICVPLAMAGFVTPLIAAIVRSTSSILVTLNAARLAGGGRS